MTTDAPETAAPDTATPPPPDDPQAAFIAYLTKKKVNVAAMRAANPQAFDDLAALFNHIGRESFDQQKKFVINDWRLDFPPATA